MKKWHNSTPQQLHNSTGQNISIYLAYCPTGEINFLIVWVDKLFDGQNSRDILALLFFFPQIHVGIKFTQDERNLAQAI